MRKAVHEHHAHPKFMAGPDIPDNLVNVADTIHARLHQMVTIIHRLNGMNVYSHAAFDKLDLGQKERSIRILYETTKAFDQACAHVKGYNKIAPTLKRIIDGL